MRDTAFWTEANTKLIRERFVAVAVNGMSMNNRADPDREFIIDLCGLRLAGAGGNIICVTAGGRQLGGKDGVRSNLQKAIEEWDALPEAERRPGAVSVEERTGADPVSGPASLPAGALVLKLHYRTLASDGKGGVRSVTPADYVSGHWMLKKGYWYEAAPDFMWITREEARALVPAEPRKGQTHAVPETITDRLFRFHLVPTMTFGESNGWQRNRKDLRAGELRLTVEEASPARIRMRLEGQVSLGAAYDAAACEKRAWNESGGVGYEPRLLGFVEIDVPAGAVTRFDLVALGETYGTLGGDLRYFYRPGRHPLGIAFELVDSAVTAHRVPPLGLRAKEMKDHGYLGAQR